jgi:hypothetical protein
MKFVLLLAFLAVVATVSEASSTETAPTAPSTAAGTAAANTGAETTNPANGQTTVVVTTQRNGASSVAGGWSLGCVLSFGIVVHLLH